MNESALDAERLRDFLSADARELAPQLLGAVLTHESRDGAVSVRLTEVEAYMGPEDSLHPDPGSHTYRGPTPRNAPMFGPAGHLYVYFTYGMHHCTNIVCGPAGTASALLLRAGEVVDGLALAQRRRPTSKSAADLASGPARLAKALGLTTADSGRDALAPPFALVLPSGPAGPVSSGPRVGVAGAGGS
ncbi:MAG: DNA-3-methyladenine glycosylase, partial [Actinomycetes bacterium]